MKVVQKKELLYMTKHPYSEKMDINNNGFSNIDEELQSLQKLLFYQIGSDLLPKTKTLPDISWELKTQPCLKTMTPMCRTVKVSPGKVILNSTARILILLCTYGIK